MTRDTDSVLEALKSAGPDACSGQVLSSRLGVSRAQIWKHVSTLRKNGYAIEGIAGGGYRFQRAPDRLYPQEIEPLLETRWLGRSLHHFEEVDSTNRIAHQLATEGAPHGTAVIAECQTAGRGRLGRSFFSPAHLNLYTSIVLRPKIETVVAPTLLLAAGIAVAEAVDQTLPDQENLEIKWPNDILIGGLKTSGILMEMVAEENRVRFAVLGIGVNLNTDPTSFPADFRDRATSLKACSKRPIDRAKFTALLYARLESVLDDHERGGLQLIRPRFENYFHMKGRRIEVSESDGGHLAGTALGVASNGALLIETDLGERKRLLAGDVTLQGNHSTTGKTHRE